MKKILALLVMVVTLTACNFDKDTMNHIAEKKDGVVAIFADDQGTKEHGLGTGFFVKENTIVTNYHVAGKPGMALKVALENGEKTYPAELVYGDKDADVAVIKIKNWDEFKKDNPQVIILKFAATEPKVTDVVYAIGHPWGLFYSVSKGIISVDGRKNPSTIPMWWIQTDAHVFQGNSGGPLLNEDGEVIGINNAMISNEGGSYGFSIPAPVVQKILNDFEKYKEVRWASLGIKMGPPGITVSEAVAGSAAAKAGIKAKDKIVGMYIGDAEGSQFNNSFDLIKALSEIDYSTPITLLVERDGDIIEIVVKPDYKTAKDFATTN